MAQITRFDGNLKPFADDALGTERTVFGAETQDDTLDANINTDFLRGWGIVGVNGLPTKQDFNAFAYTSTALSAYVHQIGVPEWHASQEYFTGSIANVAGVLFKAVQGNVGENPTTDDGSNWLQVTENSAFTLPRGFISGLNTAIDADNDHDILIKVGSCRDIDDGGDILLETQITKRIDADWAVGDNEGGFPSSLTLSPNTWYHIFVMTDGTTVDAGFDSDVDAVNLLADSSYMSYRRVGSFLTDSSSNIEPYKQYGERFMWDDVPVDYNSTATISSLTDFAISVPEGIVTLALISGDIADNTTAVSLYYVASKVAGGEYTVLFDATASSNTVVNNNDFEILADENAEIQHRHTNSSGSVNIQTKGWKDFRGNI